MRVVTQQHSLNHTVGIKKKKGNYRRLCYWVIQEDIMVVNSNMWYTFRVYVSCI